MHTCKFFSIFNIDAYLKKKKLTSTEEALVLSLGSTIWLSRRYAPPLCSLIKSLASSFLNCMVGFGSHNILMKIEVVKDMGGLP
jgi:hypothetical protein